MRFSIYGRTVLAGFGLWFRRLNKRFYSPGATSALRPTTCFARAFENIVVFVFDDDGDRIDDHRIGTVDPPGLPDGAKREIEMDLDAFPAIISAEAEKPPCEDRLIDITYWIRTDEQRGREISESEKAWEETFRECDEALPPERVIDEVEGAPD